MKFVVLFLSLVTCQRVLGQDTEAPRPSIASKLVCTNPAKCLTVESENFKHKMR